MDRMKIFISHCSADKEILDTIKATLPIVFDIKRYDCFFSGNHGLYVGENKGEGLKNRLETADFMIAIITDSYLRSVICIQELSAFWFRGMPILPIVYNGERGKAFLDGFNQNTIFIDTESDIAETQLEKGLDKNFGLQIASIEHAKKWIKAKQFDPNVAGSENARPYIGCTKAYFDVLQFCIKNGIQSFHNGVLDGELIFNKLSSKKEIYLIGTSHKGMLENHIETFSTVLSKGADIYILIGNRNSEFNRDVAAIEALDVNHHIDDATLEDEQERAGSDDFKSVKTNINRIHRSAISKVASQGGTMGRLFFGNAFTLVRQTITMGIDDNANELWANVTVTMPPKRASQTMGFIVETSADDGNPNNNTLAEDLKEHARAIRDLAKLRNALVEFKDKNSLPEAFPTQYNTIEAKKEWKQYYDTAQDLMAYRKQCDQKFDLIEIAAQHPLKYGTLPGVAFEQRLNIGISLYKELKSKGRCPKIYVPGSLHLYHGIADKVSLSSAGIKYLLESGDVDPDDILGENVNNEFKNDQGVYNSADECYVASEVYKNGAYTNLYCVCSANQMMRKKLFYFKFGIIPLIYTVPDDSFHNDMDEIFDVVPDVIFGDHDWQDTNSYHYNRTRMDRMEGFVPKN